MKGLLFFFLCLTCLSSPGFSQYLSSKDSDPEAIALLTRSSKAFTSKYVQVNFNLKLTFPGQEPKISEGVLYQSGKSYHLALEDYNILSDGITRWVYLKGPNEVNIYNESNGQDWISPQDFLQLHTSDDLVFTLTSNRPDGTSIIEAKSLKGGRFDAYSKFTIGIKNGMLSFINALSSDGTRQEMTIVSVTNPASMDASRLFTFNSARYPGVYIEDLRLD